MEYPHLFLLEIFVLLAPFASADIAVLRPDNKSVELFLDYKITYTPTIPDHGLVGYLVRASPTDACSPIAPPPTNKSDKTVWFVLADRSSAYHIRCTNREKIQHAANAGYKALILYSPSDNFFQTSIAYYSSFEHSKKENDSISIPAVLVSHEDGETLNNRYLHYTGYKIYITSDLQPNLSYYLLPFAIVIGVCLLLTISFMIFQLMRCIQERRKAQRHRLSKKYLKKLTLQKFEKGIYYETCAICLDDYIEGEKIRILPCNHAYHQKCIDPWLTKNRRVCPVCKAKVTVPGMEEFTDSDSDTNERTLLIPPERTRSHRNYRSTRNGHIRIVSDRWNASRQQASHSGAAASSSRYSQPLDDTLSQPGTSNSAPVVSQISSSRANTRKKRNARNIQIIAAEIAPLIAPPQLSINCDSETERPVTPAEITIEPNEIIQSRQARPSTSVDQIV